MNEQSSFRLKSTVTEQCEQFDIYFEKFKSDLLQMNLTAAQKSQIIKLLLEFLNECGNGTQQLIQKNPMVVEKNLNNFHGYIKSKLEMVETYKKRYKILFEFYCFHF